uniref:Immunoglobulin-like beta-sandwich domain-containing protein n=1 Tax=Kryptolebias marmoratus TaxID=37003 RepID=A0A3Q3B2S7_KRYMA
MRITVTSSALLIIYLFVCKSLYSSVLLLKLIRNIFTVLGSSAKLACEAVYDLTKCGLVHVVWRKMDEKNTELTDPIRYFTTVNETVTEINMRRRQVVTEILSVSTHDIGQYQCSAECETGERAMGHFITINVKGRPYHRDSNWSILLLFLSAVPFFRGHHSESSSSI